MQVVRTLILLAWGLLVVQSNLVAETKDWSKEIPAENLRRFDQTYLTVPEWFLVHSPAEYARFIAYGNPSEFPYIEHIEQVWESYSQVRKATAHVKEVNTDYHVMIWIIGLSTSFEYGVKYIYEKLIGRISEFTRQGAMTQEDELAAKFASEYATFLNEQPWYEFSFWKQFKSLWLESSWFGSNMIRKWERRVFLSNELLFKTFYGWVMAKMAESSYEGEILKTACVVHSIDNKSAKDLPQHFELLKELPDGRKLLLLPRYFAFAGASKELAELGWEFDNIAGNAEEILVAIQTDQELSSELTANTEVFLKQPILTELPATRYLLKVPVVQLSQFLLACNERSIQVVHVYDF